MKFISEMPYHTWTWGGMNETQFKKWSLIISTMAQYVATESAGNTQTKILDIGTGLGRNARFFASLGMDVHAVDIDPSVIEFAKQQTLDEGLSVNYKVADMLNLDYADNSFDIVYAENILSLTYGAAQIRAVDEIHRVLKPAGRAYMQFDDISDLPPMGYRGTQVGKNTYMVAAQYGRHPAPRCYVDDIVMEKLMHGFRVMKLQSENRERLVIGTKVADR